MAAVHKLFYQITLRGLICYSAVLAMLLWANVVENGVKWSRDQLTEFLNAGDFSDMDSISVNELRSRGWPLCYMLYTNQSKRIGYFSVVKLTGNVFVAITIFAIIHILACRVAASQSLPPPK